MFIEKYHKWINSPYVDNTTKKELEMIRNNTKEIEERFYRDLEFGTGGLRGIIGVGTNRMNVYTVRIATQGLANYLKKKVHNSEKKGVVIAYDSRHKSPEFAEEAALVLNGNGIKVYLLESLRPTPELSFAVRELGCAAGIVITASHNPSRYNGYKVYGEDGGQIVTDMAEKILHEIENISDFSHIHYIDKQKALNIELLQIIGEEIDQKYIENVKSLAIRKEVIQEMAEKLTILYTPLHGTGNIPVRRVLNEIGFSKVNVVPEQELPDPDFSTVASPNPEDHEAFTLALNMAEELQPDIILGTDPDCDRVGVMAKNSKGEYEVLTGNQIGALLAHYIVSSMKAKGILLGNGVVIKTIVTSEMGVAIARSFGVDTLDTLTGFKYIGEKINEFEATKEKQFLFGYEESYGYLAGTFVRDKDAVIASMLICEMAAYYKSKNMTLYDGLLALFKEYGYYLEDLQSITLNGREGTEKIQNILTYFREYTPNTVGDNSVKIFRDYKTGKGYDFQSKQEQTLTLPKSNVLHFTLDDDSWFCIRPSGTEPKIKIYYSVIGKNIEDAHNRLNTLKSDVSNSIKKLL